MRQLSASILVLLVLAGCTGRGVVLGDGGIRDNTAENARAHVIALIARDLDAKLGADARAEVAIAGLPRWLEAGRRHSEGWYWDQAGVQVDLVGAAGAPPTLDRAEVDAVVARRLRPAVLGDDLLVRVSAVADAERFARLAGTPAPVLAPARPMEPAVAAPRRYRVQAGDTLAELSLAFYGSAQHWRLIRDANPGSAGGALRVGQELVIPPRP